MELTLFHEGGLFALAQVLMIDVVLAGDNAVVIGLAAARVPVAMRKKVIFWGLIAAVVLRIAMAAVAVQLLAIIGLTLAGGILLLWVCWRMWRDIAGDKDHIAPQIENTASAKRAIIQILVADLSMSLDNVLAVAGAARDHLDVLIIGLLMSVGLMGAAANFIARLLERYRWVAYIGLLIVVYVALSMIYHGWEEVAKVVG
jgi:YjbE family integral membrane protein